MEKELLYRFFSGEATIEQEKQVLDWLDADPAHQRELFSERRLFDALLLHVDSAQVRREARRWVLPRWTREVVKYAAVILIAAGVSGVYISRLNDKLLAATNTISVPAGQRVDLVLPDGTKVCMNALSELKYPAFFAGEKRTVQLKGEAYFDVTHDVNHPFVVETFACDVEVLGTSFDVEARPETGDFVTSLIEGAVCVRDHNDRSKQVVLAPRQQVYHKDGQLVVSAIPEHEDFLWREGVIAFREASFVELLHEFEGYYGVKIELARQDVSGQLFTGKIRITDGVDHALRVLQRSADFTFVRNETRDIIYIH